MSKDRVFPSSTNYRYYVHQATGVIDHLLDGSVTYEGLDSGVVQHQLTYLCLANVGGNLDALTYLPVDLYDQCEGFVLGHGLIVAGPLGRVNAPSMASQMPQFFSDVRSHGCQQLHHRFQGLTIRCAACY